MKNSFRAQTLAALCALLIVRPFCAVADPASDLAAGVRTKQEGSQYVRMRMETADKQILQLQSKSRVSGDTSDIVYQVLFPKERKGESVLLHRSGGKFSGTLFVPPNETRAIASGQIDQALFGSDLSYEDIIDSPFAWTQQAVVGNETINGTACQILESKPGKGRGSSYSKVKSWIDPKRFVPLRIEKYDASGKMLRRINTTRVLLAGDDSLPSNLSVQGPRGITEIDGSKIKRAVTYTDSEFTATGLKQLSIPADAPN